MKKRVVTILTLFLIFTTGYAQKYDNVWLWGYFPQYQDTYWWTGNGRIDFEADTFSLSAKSYNDVFRYSSNFFSDKDGHLEIYTNGMWLRDTTGNKIMNGDSLNYGAIWESWEQAAIDGTGAYSYPEGVFFLPMPENDSIIYAIQHIANNTANQLNDTMAYSIIARNSNGYNCTIKNQMLPNAGPPTFRNVAACKHGNGRDWWVFYNEYFTNCIQKYMLTQDGLVYIGIQCIGDTVKASANSLFSPDGSLFIRSDFAATYTNVFNFDRCSGQIDQLRRITPTTIIDTVAHNVIDYQWGSAISSSNRYYYTVMGNYVFQYDLSAINIDSTRDTVATVYGLGLTDTINGGEVYYGFQMIQEGGDGKLYISPFYGSWHLSYINEPNKRGDSCDFRMMGLALPKWWDRGMPYYPNYRLGRLIGSACDTVYSDVKPIYKESPWLKVYPNPATDNVRLEYNWVEWEKYTDVRCKILDLRGTAVMQMQIPRYSSWQTVNVKGLAAGGYIVTLQGNGKTLAVAKLSKVE
ncbi:MAG: T9SS type A sorting domain-containing protein [Chitinophagales bacterium]